MRIAIVATHLTEEQDRLKETAIKRGHDVDILEVKKFSLTFCNENPDIFYAGKTITKDYDAVIPRIDIPYTDFGFKVLRQFQAVGIYVTDTAYSLELARNKLRCLQYFTRKNIPFPKTGFSYAAKGYDEVLENISGKSYIIKLNEGTQGMGVFLAEDDKQAKNFLGTFQQLDTEVMVQEFIEESSGTDLRCFVVGDKVVASMSRKSQDGDFRANVSLGGHAFEVNLTDEEEKLSLDASKSVGMNISGVDIIRSERGPLVIEINTAPDFCGEWGLEKVSGIDVANEILKFTEESFAKLDKGEGRWLEEPVTDASQVFKFLYGYFVSFQVLTNRIIPGYLD